MHGVCQRVDLAVVERVVAAEFSGGSACAMVLEDVAAVYEFEKLHGRADVESQGRQLVAVVDGRGDVVEPRVEGGLHGVG